jgi:molecular chaperone DnaK
VGQLARRQAILNPQGTIYSAKRFIRRYDEVASEREAVSFDVVPGPDGAARFGIRGKQYAPEEISALVLRKLVADAAKFLGEKVTVSGDAHTDLGKTKGESWFRCRWWPGLCRL